MTRWDRVDRFEGPTLDESLWVPHFLPHWSTPDASAARYHLAPDGLVLRIDADQPPWREGDASRASNIQTGEFAGPLGSTVGQHRFAAEGLTVATERAASRLWVASAGEVEIRASACPSPDTMMAFWLLGHEQDDPSEAGEILLAELYGSMIGPMRSTVRTGVKAHHDPRLRDDIRDIDLEIDATAPHTYGTRWGADGVSVTVDGREIFASQQVLAYPLQLMIDLFEFAVSEDRTVGYPKTATVHEVRLRAE